MKLTDRLYKIASFVSEGKRVADIGTDHGYIPVYLLNKGTIPFAILADINKGPLENARKEVRHNGLEAKTELRLGSGIEVLEKGEVDEIIIAGMGGALIADILEAKKEVAQSAEKLILQPMQAQEELRKYLLNNGYEIMEEVLENEDFRIYEIMTARYIGKNNTPSDEIYYEVGEKLLNNKNELFTEFVEKKIRTNKAILEKFEGIDNENIRKRREEVESKIEKLEKML
ncbi:tRNA (adenine(22)-N(1))-methyltransferase [Peptacetobacter sp.]|uniref:tRNA (adenine(22)-N(1))-methyltransferase n=1 Tax=Peptacetobacter sp. TaxID=2991975 RepID=UPI0026314514|nr:class I SAM-dependent methyltransferase [Peptacetobacter sp.]MEE0452293.1 class I SAM-dependent methyltransferase [Peptacetobacter sp.]